MKKNLSFMIGTSAKALFLHPFFPTYTQNYYAQCMISNFWVLGRNIHDDDFSISPFEIPIRNRHLKDHLNNVTLKFNLWW